MTHLRAALSAVALVSLIGCSDDPASPRVLGSLSGVIRDSDGASAAHAWVSLSPAEADVPLAVNTTAGDDGAFSFSDVEPGDYVVSARAEPPGDGVAARRVRIPGLQSGSLVLTLGVPGAVTGSATLSGAGSHEGTMISAQAGWDIATTDASGAYRHGGMPPGTGRVDATHLGYAPGSVVVTIPSPGATVVAPDLVLSPAPQAP